MSAKSELVLPYPLKVSAPIVLSNKIYLNLINTFVMSKNKHINKKIMCFFLESSNKAVLEPRVLPAFAITYFCNHCNIRFENTSKYVDTATLFIKNLNQRSLTPK